MLTACYVVTILCYNIHTFQFETTPLSSGIFAVCSSWPLLWLRFWCLSVFLTSVWTFKIGIQMSPVLCRSSPLEFSKMEVVMCNCSPAFTSPWSANPPPGLTYQLHKLLTFMIRGREELLMVHFDPPTNPMLPLPVCVCAQGCVSVQCGRVPCPQWQIGLNTILAAEAVVCDLWWGKGQGTLTHTTQQVIGFSKWRGRESESSSVLNKISIHCPNMIVCVEMNSFLF